jgi:hypothetical protein
MFPTNLYEFKTNQKELHRRAAHYRLVKSLEQPRRWADRISAAVGRMLIVAGQNLVKRTQAAH